MPYARVLKRMRDAVRAGNYVVTIHADEEMDDDGFLVEDVERAILCGEIVHRQTEATTGQSKYVIHGDTGGRGLLGVVTSFGCSGKLVFITVFAI